MNWRDWKKNPTAEGHMEYHTPAVDIDSEDWQWPYWKFGYLHPDVLFKELHAEYNSIPCAIQDHHGWWIDVCEIANIADNRPQFLALLKERQAERFKELEKAWDTISSLLVGQPSRWRMKRDMTDLWVRFIRVSRHWSYDAIVGYFGAYVKEINRSKIAPEPPVEPEYSEESERRQQTLREIEQASTAEAGPSNIETRPFLASSTPDITMQQGESQLQTERRAVVEGKKPERRCAKPLMVDAATQTETPGTKRAVAKPKRPARKANESPNRVVKPRTRRSKPGTSNPEGLRRSARLQKLASGGS
ncbi:hypothetical protein F5Y03DRAFT_378377 [Xylaria venustula]|nr:hypothetical protein F5Y03DRAFT_378377 [Xylaria venustula]